MITIQNIDNERVALSDCCDFASQTEINACKTHIDAAYLIAQDMLRRFVIECEYAQEDDDLQRTFNVRVTVKRERATISVDNVIVYRIDYAAPVRTFADLYADAQT
jgi:hypothetical protein